MKHINRSIYHDLSLCTPNPLRIRLLYRCLAMQSDNPVLTKIVILWYCLLENMIDGTALLCLTERALEILMPIIGHRMKFLRLLKELEESNNQAMQEVDVDAPVVEVEEVPINIEGDGSEAVVVECAFQDADDDTENTDESSYSM